MIPDPETSIDNGWAIWDIEFEWWWKDPVFDPGDNNSVAVYMTKEGAEYYVKVLMTAGWRKLEIRPVMMTVRQLLDEEG